MKKRIIITSIIVSVIVICCFSFIYLSGSNKGLAAEVIPGLFTNKDNDAIHTYNPNSSEYDDNNDFGDKDTDMANVTEQEEPFVPATEVDLDPTSITVLVNKEYSLPKNYVPENLVIPNVLFDIDYFEQRKLLRPVAATALEELFAAAEKEGVILCGISGYRSYERQYKIFTSNIVLKGKTHTLKYSAVPGTSEHQTGLAIDVSSKSMQYKLVTSFATSTEGIWLAENSYKFGYIIRYPEDKTEITGYAYEPWHIRYVGKDLAKYLYTNKLTLDEYYKYTPSINFDFEAVYADLINYVPPADADLYVDPDDENLEGLTEENENIEVPVDTDDIQDAEEPTDVPDKKPPKGTSGKDKDKGKDKNKGQELDGDKTTGSTPDNPSSEDDDSIESDIPTDTPTPTPSPTPTPGTDPPPEVSPSPSPDPSPDGEPSPSPTDILSELP